MTTQHSTKPEKPAEPYPGSPLKWHAAGRWYKYAKGRMWYFKGTAEEALDEWLRIRDEVYACCDPNRLGPDDITVRYICNHFLTQFQRRVNARELTGKTFDRYERACRQMVDVLGGDQTAFSAWHYAKRESVQRSKTSATSSSNSAAVDSGFTQIRCPNTTPTRRRLPSWMSDSTRQLHRLTSTR